MMQKGKWRLDPLPQRWLSDTPTGIGNFFYFTQMSSFLASKRNTHDIVIVYQIV